MHPQSISAAERLCFCQGSILLCDLEVGGEKQQMCRSHLSLLNQYIMFEPSEILLPALREMLRGQFWIQVGRRFADLIWGLQEPLPFLCCWDCPGTCLWWGKWKDVSLRRRSGGVGWWLSKVHEQRIFLNGQEINCFLFFFSSVESVVGDVPLSLGRDWGYGVFQQLQEHRKDWLCSLSWPSP